MKGTNDAVKLYLPEAHVNFYSMFFCYENAPLRNKTVSLKNSKISKELSFSLSKLTTRSQK